MKKWLTIVSFIAIVTSISLYVLNFEVDYLKKSNLTSLHFNSMLGMQERNDVGTDEWVSDDGRIQLQSYYEKVGTDGTYDYYDVWAIARWIEMPKIKGIDGFVLGHNSYYDDSIETEGYVIQKFKCDICKQVICKTTHTDEMLCYTSDGIYFLCDDLNCNICGNSMTCTDYKAFIRYKIIAMVDSEVKTHVVYGHLMSEDTQLTVYFNQKEQPVVNANKRIFKIYSEGNLGLDEYEMKIKEKEKYLFLVINGMIIILTWIFWYRKR